MKLKVKLQLLFYCWVFLCSYLDVQGVMFCRCHSGLCECIVKQNHNGVSVCVSVCTCACVCMCMCVWEKEIVCVCVCVHATMSYVWVYKCVYMWRVTYAWACVCILCRIWLVYLPQERLYSVLKTILYTHSLTWSSSYFSLWRDYILVMLSPGKRYEQFGLSCRE